MKYIIRIILLALVALIGSFIPSILFFIGIKSGWWNTEVFSDSDSFRLAFVGGMMWAWIIGTALGIGFLFISGKIKQVFLSMPIICPLIYGVFVMYTGFGL